MSDLVPPGSLFGAAGPKDPVIATQLVLPWQDLGAQAVPEDYLTLQPDLLATLAVGVAQGPDRARLLRTDAVGHLLTATDLNSVEFVTAPALAGQNQLQVGDVTTFPPGTFVALIPQAGLQLVTPDRVYQVVGWVNSNLLLSPNLLSAAAVGDFAVSVGVVSPMSAVLNQVLIGSVGPIANGGSGSSTFSLPRGVQMIGLRVAVTGGLGASVNYQVQGVQSGTVYLSITGAQLLSQPWWVTVDSAEDTQLTLTVTPPALPAGSATGFLVGSYAPLTPSQLDVSDRNTRALGQVFGSRGATLQQDAASSDLLVQLQSAGANIDPRQIRSLTSTDVVTANPGPAALWQAPNKIPALVVLNAAIGSDTQLIAGVAGQTIRLFSIDISFDAGSLSWFRFEDTTATQFAAGALNAGLVRSFRFNGAPLSVGAGLRVLNEAASAAAWIVRGSIVYSQG